MIKLADIINESRQPGLLYHSTSGNNLISILRSNIMRVGQNDFASYSRSKLHFTRDKNYRPEAYTIELNKNKLANKYKILPTTFILGNRDEAEEIIQKDITDIKKYINNIYANVNYIQDRPIKELEKVMSLYPGLKFTVGGESDIGRGGEKSPAVREIPKAEALIYIKYNKY